MLELRKEGDVAVITMTNGANKQDVTFATNLNSLLEKVIQDENVHALVIASSDSKNGSQGIDVEWMMGAQQTTGGQDVKTFFDQLDQVYTRLMLLPVPAIAAINGHAFGAGAFLATACDYRFMNSQREYSGKRVTAVELEKFLIVEASCNGIEETFDKAMAFAASFKKDQTLIASYKRQLHGSAAEKILELNRQYLEKSLAV